MDVLNFQTNKKTYKVNDGCEISFDPTDISFVNKLFDLLNKAEGQTGNELQTIENVFEVAAKKDKQMRADIDALFGEPVCEKIFGTANVFSPAGGLPLYMNFLLALIDEVDAAAEKESEPSARVDAYVQKYEKKYGKYMKK